MCVCFLVHPDGRSLLLSLCFLARGHRRLLDRAERKHKYKIGSRLRAEVTSRTVLAFITDVLGVTTVSEDQLHKWLGDEVKVPEPDQPAAAPAPAGNGAGAGAGAAAAAATGDES